MKPSEFLAEELDINGVLRYDSERGHITTQTFGPRVSRSQLYDDLQAAIALSDRLNEAIESMESFLEKPVDKHLA